MKLDTHFKLQAMKHLVLKGHFIQAVAIPKRFLGYHIEDNAVRLHFKRSIKLTLDRPAYSIDYYQECHKSGIHLKHWSSRLKIRREVYEVYVTDGEQELVITTTNPHVSEYIRTQHDAIGHIPDRTVRYNNHSLHLPMDFHGFGVRTDTRTFKNQAAYELFEETVELVKR